MLPTILASSAMMASLSAQQPRMMRIGPEVPMPSFAPGVVRAESPSAVIGVSTTAAATSRDTLGVLVSQVESGSPAEKAGIKEGDRIAAVNGVSLRLTAADIGDDEMAGVLSRRLNGALQKLSPGDNVSLQLYADGKLESMTIKTVAPADLYETAFERRLADRPTLGLDVVENGSARDSLGVFVLSVDDSGPAAKAGIIEGSRIASINGVDLREHGGAQPSLDRRSSSVSRLENEVARIKPGDDVELHVVYDGRSRTVKVKAARTGDLPRRARTFAIMGGNAAAMIPDVMERVEQLDVPQIGNEVRRTLARAFRDDETRW